MATKMYRHGDVIIREVTGLPEGSEKREGLTLALGEVTGHSHRMADGDAALFGFDDRTYLQVQSEIATLVHEEHHALSIPRGTYEIVIQREYVPGGWSYVAD